MTDLIPPRASRPVPPAIRIATWLLAASGAAFALSGIETAIDLVTWGGYVDRAAAGVHATAAEAATEKSANTNFDIAMILIFAALVLLCVGAIRLIRRGASGGRVMAILVSAPALACTAVAFVPASESALQAAASARQPGWLDLLGYVGLLFGPLAFATLGLLCTPSARAWFKPAMPMIPPPAGYMYVPVSSWPNGVPGYPSYPPSWAYPPAIAADEPAPGGPDQE